MKTQQNIAQVNHHLNYECTEALTTLQNDKTQRAYEAARQNAQHLDLLIQLGHTYLANNKPELALETFNQCLMHANGCMGEFNLEKIMDGINRATLIQMGIK